MSVKISELTASSAVTSNDFIPIVDYETATTKRASANQVLNYVTGSTFNTLTVTNLTSSNVTASRIDVEQIYVTDVIGGNISGDATGLTNIPATGIQGSIQYNESNLIAGDSYLTYDAENFKLISQNADFTSVTVGDISGTTAQFTTITSSNLVVSGGNAIFYEVAEIGDNAYVLYNSSIDKLAAFPGLYVTGAITASTSLSASNVGATTGVFSIVSASIVSASSYVNLPTSSGGTPGGTNQTIQFNSGSTFSGSTNFVWNYTNNRLGVGKSSPNATLDVNGDTIISGNLIVTGSTTLSGDILMYGTASLSANPTAAYIYYDSNIDKLKAFPGLNISGSTIVSGNLIVTGSNSSIAFSASNSLHWTATTPVTLQEALNRIAAAIYSGITGSIA